VNKTVDGVEIVDGLLAWNNKLDLCRVHVPVTFEVVTSKAGMTRTPS
jgi:hypothetical protein